MSEKIAERRVQRQSILYAQWLTPITLPASLASPEFCSSPPYVIPCCVSGGQGTDALTDCISPQSGSEMSDLSVPVPALS